jgi:histidinol dehydrogenase
MLRRLRFQTAEWTRYLDALPRGGAPRPEVESAVTDILRQVRREGDRALLSLTARYDGVRLAPSALHVPVAEIEAQAKKADRDVVRALQAMTRRITAFHQKQLQRGFSLRLPDGSLLEEVVAPLATAGLYVPGGAGAYPSSVLMNAIPARVAGVPHLAVVTPPRTLDENPAVAAALVIVKLQGAVYRVGGAQAVAALAYGTKTVPAVAKIVGPGNAYVAAAKRQVRGLVEIDQEAGPSEVAILADDTADAGWVAADLLAQAEHGSGEETVVLVTPSEALANEVARLCGLGLGAIANAENAERALRRNGAIVLVDDLKQGVQAMNALAAEHAEVMTRGASVLAKEIVAGAVFVGPYAPVAVGDYGVGPNHVLPTGGGARFSSPLSVRDFQRRSSRVTLTRKGLQNIVPDVVRVAMAEGFRGHAQSVLTRFEA